MKTTSLKVIVARLTAYRIMDSTFLDDLLEWLPQGMRQLKTRMQLETDAKDEIVVDHVAFLPKGLVNLDLVETLEIDGESYRSRLREGSGRRHLPTIPVEENTNNLFVSDPISVEKVYIPTDQITDEGVVISEGYYTEYKFVGYRSLIPYNGQDISKSKTIYVTPPYYTRQPNSVHTSFKEGKIRFHFLKQPVDKEGYPLIPDNENYKVALEWFGWSQMIKAGYEHPMFDYEYCNQKFELYGRRAINEITYPSIDRMERTLQSQVRLIPPTNYYETFEETNFKSNEQIL